MAGLATASCGSGGGGVAVYPVAVGARGAVPTWNGPCDAARPRGDAVTFDGARYVAARAGDVELACERGSIRLAARPVAALRIDGPAAPAARWTAYRLVALDADGAALALGDAEVEWTLSAALERDAGCHGHLVASCDPPSVARVRRRAEGEATLVASLGARRATRRLGAP